MTEKVTNNRDNLIHMIALVEEIDRTNSRLYELLRGLMNNPHELANVKTSINMLYDKITKLKNSDIGTPLVDFEKTIVPGPADASPKTEEKPVPKPTPETFTEQYPQQVDHTDGFLFPGKDQTFESSGAGEPPKETRRNTHKSRKNVGVKQPKGSLKGKKKLPSPDIDSI